MARSKAVRNLELLTCSNVLLPLTVEDDDYMWLLASREPPCLHDHVL